MHIYREQIVTKFTLDELLGTIGGLIGVITFFAGFFISPYSQIKFIIDNQSRKEELELGVFESIKSNQVNKYSKRYD